MLTNLRGYVDQDPTCKEKFEEAEKLAKSLFDLKKEGKKMIPFFTDHTIAHMAKVEDNLDRIVCAPGMDGNAFIPSPEEAMYLLSACWLHDVGMIYGIFDGENSQGPDVDWNGLRNTHEERTAKYLTQRWQQHCSWSSTEKTYLAEFCIYHRQRYLLADMEPAEINGRSGKAVRLRELAAILRLADACHVDESRAPVDLKNLFDSFGMPAISQDHWGIPRLIHGVEFDHRSHTIPLHCLLPPPKRYGTATIDFQGVIDRVVGGLKAELSTVIPWLSGYSNTDFKNVEAKIVRPKSLADPEGHMMEMWPSIIKMFSSASETACMVAALVKAACRDCSEVPKKKIYEILDMALYVHPYNFLIRGLDAEMRQLLSKECSVGDVKRCKERYLKEREERCVQVARQARRVISDGDVIVVSGYSRTLLTLLTEQLVGHGGKVLIVKCPATSPGLIARDGNARLLDELRKSGLSCIHLENGSLVEILQNFRRTGQPVKVLLAAQGVFNGGEVLAAVGSSLISLAAKAVGFPVYILAEPEKRISDDETRRKMEQLLKEQADWLIHTDADGDKPAEIAAQVDCLMPDMYTAIITSEPTAVDFAVAKQDEV